MQYVPRNETGVAFRMTVTSQASQSEIVMHKLPSEVIGH